ncbi:type II secretion system protein [Rhodoferax sp. U11-2br]|uniref:type II secretion system protein n=1 Tax=Rhodoferax sp. U11-2br TaxID=2838878 RepID=UPI001BE7CE06|nr:prepilin-type N-terminal cleavage/methylation domain-containing protein [Rhodoferax sp. U11-2br]MBT3067988.1 prepilin-type N-terminal cleavage/methylation domain-containing protein [Rhodoferax sp. U11-2br]
MRRRGFTLIELMVVMAIIATLLSIVAPRYFAHLDRAREAALRETLAVVRDSIDKFHADTGRYPAELGELVSKRYLRKLPVDPVSDSSETWVIVPAPGELTGVSDLKSGAGGEEMPYAQW